MVEDGVIRAGDTVLLRLPTGDIKSCKLEANSCVTFTLVYEMCLILSRTVSLGKFGSFLADALVDQPYGLTYEINNKTVSVIPPRPIEELGKKTFDDALEVFDDVTEDTDATNELINDGQFVQPLTASEIETLKQSGVHASVTSYGQTTALTETDGPGRRKSSRNKSICTQITLLKLSTAKINTRNGRPPSKRNRSVRIRFLSLQVKVF